MRRRGALLAAAALAAAAAGAAGCGVKGPPRPSGAPERPAPREAGTTRPAPPVPPAAEGAR